VATSFEVDRQGPDRGYAPRLWEAGMGLLVMRSVQKIPTSPSRKWLHTADLGKGGKELNEVVTPLGRKRTAGVSLVALPVFLLAACQPRVALEAPKDPIVINLNVKIEQEVRVKVEKDVEDLFEDNEDLF
jgi:hypothetical protein